MKGLFHMIDGQLKSLCSVNDTIIAPGNFDSFLTVINKKGEECYSTNNCTSDMPVYVTYYTDATCDAASAEYWYGDRISENFSYGQRFYNDDSGSYT
jgi:hypothetical protein